MRQPPAGTHAPAATGRGWLQRTSPIPKLAWLLASLVVIVLTYDIGPQVIAVIAFGTACVSSGVGRLAALTVVGTAPITASILVLQGIAAIPCQAGGCSAAGSIGPVLVYGEGVGHGITLVLRLVALEFASVALLATTAPADLFAALRRLGVPHLAATTALLSLRLVPLIGRELREVLDAQRARGVAHGRIRSLAAALVPVTAITFDRLTIQVMSLQVRGLGQVPRTSYRDVRLGRRGMAAALLAIPAAAGGGWLAVTRWGAGQAQPLVPPDSVSLALVAGSAVLFCVLTAAGVRRLAHD